MKGRDDRLERIVSNLERISKLVSDLDSGMDFLDPFLSSLPVFTFVIDGDGKVEDCFIRDKGSMEAPRESLLGRNLAEVIPGHHSARTMAGWKKAREEKVPVVEGFTAPPDRGGGHYEGVFIPLGQDRTVVLVKDVTEQKRTETELDRFVERLRWLHRMDKAILEARPLEDIFVMAADFLSGRIHSSRISVAFFDTEGGTAKVFMASAKGETEVRDGTSFRLQRVPDIGRMASGGTVIIEDTDEVMEPDPIMSKLRSEGVRSILNVPLRTEGMLLGSLNLGSDEPHAFAEGDVELCKEVANVIAIAIHQARLRDEVRRHTSELEERVAKRTADLEAFTYSVSHDLRSPLRAMEGFAQALLEDHGDGLDDEGRDYARRIIGATQRMEDLINDLLTYSRLSRAKPELGRVSTTAVIDEVLDGMEAEIEEAKAMVSVDGPIPDVVAHEGTLVQVMENLLSNAIKFVAPDRQPEVIIGGEPVGDRVRISVTDNGIGIPEEYKDRIFGVFERLHGSERYPGTGLGLSIVQIGVRHMKGEVGFRTNPKKGTVFWVDLPSAEGV